MNRKQQGDLGVAAAILHYTKQGYSVLLPLSDNNRYDLVIDSGERLIKVQVKTTGQIMNSGNYRVELSTQGGNQSWSGIIKRIDESECDLVFVYCLNGTFYEFDSKYVANKRNMVLGKSQESYICGYANAGELGQAVTLVS